MLIFENVLFEVLFENVAKSVGRTLGFFIEKRWARSSLTVLPSKFKPETTPWVGNSPLVGPSERGTAS